ncbi:ABC transporter ATP-binding protein [Mameliella sediminis]|uniref:ABC transporter ATP-binding protein n=1 Tax=Mameliella sediminis TaxID=2836866 RepID=UPI001C46D85F|nr:oligopeptide/dipeptide ABC transporter ATP-binding protein [Mameliella sediminis]MBY6116093.1 ATP-binding cassette domain-containing protein [Antarctobacter heliothermus]MBY6146058.1 ATP-binding cassette domain-containing protein [Mameliella alba]MBV7396948.1 ATP-binding cassette domain-containing protein [Mameliella sediminis]MBY6161763.1 ATP-binding cassette domain-containing protein [Mameliella alba]MBY6170233.1 ATP-binding cassette domain-containing protein [Mameliella alba]
MTDPILSVRDLHVSFASHQGKRFPWSPPRHLHAVNGVSFDIQPGRVLGVVGESGCGKSTLIRAIAGLGPRESGTVTLEGKTVDYARRADLNRLRRRVQMIFQDPMASLNPRMTVREIVAEPLRYFQPDQSADQRRTSVIEMLDRVGIAQRNMNRFPHEFSGGQCQRIGIARALIARPQILLCDEPVSALDVSIQAQVINLLKDLQADMGLTLIFVAHDLGVVRHISDDILVMYMGGMMEMAPSRDLVANPRHPYTQALLSAVPVPDPRVKPEPQILTGDLPSPLNLPQGCLFQTRCPKRIDACARQRPELIHRRGRQVACLLEDNTVPA